MSIKRKCVFYRCNNHAVASAFCYKHWMLFEAGELAFSKRLGLWYIMRVGLKNKKRSGFKNVK